MHGPLVALFLLAPLVIHAQNRVVYLYATSADCEGAPDLIQPFPQGAGCIPLANDYSSAQFPGDVPNNIRMALWTWERNPQARCAVNAISGGANRECVKTEFGERIISGISIFAPAAKYVHIPMYSFLCEFACCEMSLRIAN